MALSTSKPSTTDQLGAAPERTLGQMVADASADVSGLVRSEIELAKTEIKNDVTHAGKGIGMFAGAAFFGLYAFGLLLLGAAWGIAAAGLPIWAGLLIVAGVLLLIAAILALVGKGQVSKVKGKPVKAIDNAQLTIAAVKPAPKPERQPETASPRG